MGPILCDRGGSRKSTVKVIVSTKQLKIHRIRNCHIRMCCLWLKNLQHGKFGFSTSDFVLLALILERRDLSSTHNIILVVHETLVTRIWKRAKTRISLVLDCGRKRVLRSVGKLWYYHCYYCLVSGAHTFKESWNGQRWRRSSTRGNNDNLIWIIL
jgi:hypothetical protein